MQIIDIYSPNFWVVNIQFIEIRTSVLIFIAIIIFFTRDHTNNDKGTSLMHS